MRRNYRYRFSYDNLSLPHFKTRTGTKFTLEKNNEALSFSTVGDRKTVLQLSAAAWSRKLRLLRQAVVSKDTNYAATNWTGISNLQATLKQLQLAVLQIPPLQKERSTDFMVTCPPAGSLTSAYRACGANNGPGRDDFLQFSKPKRKYLVPISSKWILRPGKRKKSKTTKFSSPLMPYRGQV